MHLCVCGGESRNRQLNLHDFVADSPCHALSHSIHTGLPIDDEPVAVQCTQKHWRCNQTTEACLQSLNSPLSAEGRSMMNGSKACWCHIAPSSMVPKTKVVGNQLQTNVRKGSFHIILGVPGIDIHSSAEALIWVLVRKNRTCFYGYCAHHHLSFLVGHRAQPQR